MTNATTTITLTQSYSPYGETIASAGSGFSPYQFTGEMRDANGLTYLRARYLDSGTGRFISRDIWGGDYNRPLSLNRWGYVEGNPVNYIDPTGHYATSSTGNVAVPAQPSTQAQIYSVLARTGSQEVISSAFGCSELLQNDDDKCKGWVVCANDLSVQDMQAYWDYSNGFLSIMSNLSRTTERIGIVIGVSGIVTFISSNGIALAVLTITGAIVDPEPISKAAMVGGLALTFAGAAIGEASRNTQDVANAIVKSGAYNSGGTIIAGILNVKIFPRFGENKTVGTAIPSLQQILLNNWARQNLSRSQ